MGIVVVFIRMVPALIIVSQNHDIVMARRRADHVLSAANVVSCVVDAKEGVAVKAVVLNDERVGRLFIRRRASGGDALKEVPLEILIEVLIHVSNSRR